MTSVDQTGYDVAINDEQDSLSVDPQWLTEIARSVLTEEGVRECDLSIALVNDVDIHRVNAEFLKHDYATDVISFLFEADAHDTSRAAAPDAVNVPQRIDGEVVISVETAVRCAQNRGCRPEHELALYLVHGLLHLCGYDDQSQTDLRQMRSRERSHLQILDIPANYED